MPTRCIWQEVDGILLLDKSPGMTSNDALQKARRQLSAAKGGHTGTLDPMASGLLPLCLGEATKFANDLLDADKTYLARLRLGQRTDTADADGVLVEERPVRVGREDLDRALPTFTGSIMQIPPMHSALKRGGVPLYRLARQGVEVVREARPVTIHALEVTEFSPPWVGIRVKCSKGTYIRTLVQDLGEVLGCGAHLTALRRESVGPLEVAEAISLDQLEALSPAQRSERLLPVDALLSRLPAVVLEGEAALRFRNGNAVAVALPGGDRFRAYAAGRLLGVGRRDAGGLLQPQRLIRPGAGETGDR